MRVIGGYLKGRHLVSFQAAHIRPTTDRVKESLFNILRNDMDGAMVLDLFAGTGSLGIEAISRGAARAVMVEKHRQSLQIIQKNLQALELSEQIEVLPFDVFKYLKTSDYAFDLAFIDPPFTQALAHDVMTALSQSAAGRPGALIAIESAKKEHIEDEYSHIKLLDRRHFGDKCLSIFRKENPL